MMHFISTMLLILTCTGDNFFKYHCVSYFREFEEGYCELLKRRFGTKRVHCNIVYQEYIAHRDHVHMNSTMWETLTDFVKWLGREGEANWGF